MPIENEIKLVLVRDFSAASLIGWAHMRLRQGYLDNGPRLRQEGDNFRFNYKRYVAARGGLIEIETDMTERDFEALWPECTDTLMKDRYTRHIGNNEWAVDFFRTPDEKIYFVMAEVEMPEGVAEPDVIPQELRGHVIYRPDRGDTDFTSKKLADPAHASALYARMPG